MVFFGPISSSRPVLAVTTSEGMVTIFSSSMVIPILDQKGNFTIKHLDFSWLHQVASLLLFTSPSGQNTISHRNVGPFHWWYFRDVKTPSPVLMLVWYWVSHQELGDRIMEGEEPGKHLWHGNYSKSIEFMELRWLVALWNVEMSVNLKCFEAAGSNNGDNRPRKNWIHQ